MPPKPKILLIDDDVMLLELYKVKFLANGFEVTTTASGEDALALLASNYRPDVILFDITMPGMSGYELLDAMNSLHLPKKCLKIALTNEGKEAAKKRTVELGVHAHLVKAEFTPGELVIQVRELMQKYA